MQIEEIFSDGIETSKKLLDDTPKLLILAVIAIIPIVNFILLGYFARIIRNGSSDLPPLSDYVGLFIDGLKIFLVLLAYLLIPLILIFAGVWTTVISGGFALTFFAFGVILSLLIALIAAMGIVHMVYTENLVKAFSFGEIIEVIRTAGWGNYIIWILSIWVLSLIISAFSQITPAGWLITAFISPFFTVFVARTAYVIYSIGAGITMD